MIEATFVLSFEESRRGQRLYAGKSQWFQQPIWLFIGLTQVVLALTLAAEDRWHWTLESTVFMASSITVLLAIVFAGRWMRLRRAKRRFSWKVDGLEPTELLIDKLGIRVTIADKGTAYTQWNAYRGWKEDAAVFALLGRGTVMTIPKRALADVQQEALRSLLAAQLGDHSVAQSAP